MENVRICYKRITLIVVFDFFCNYFSYFNLWRQTSCLCPSIELQVQEQPTDTRSAIYSHLEAFVPCNKEALLKRLKKLSLNIQVCFIAAERVLIISCSCAFWGGQLLTVFFFFHLTHTHTHTGWPAAHTFTEAEAGCLQCHARADCKIQHGLHGQSYKVSHLF